MARYIYQTEFSLTNPVNNFSAAQRYLQEDDMTKYLKDRLEYDKSDIDSACIEKIEWELLYDDAGVITLITTKELTKAQLDEISDWVRGQNSDGLGEGFEQQEFAEVYDDADVEDDWGGYFSDVIDMASFDWQTNKYKFSLMKKDGSDVKESFIKEASEKLEYNVLIRRVQIYPDMDDDDWAFEHTKKWLAEISGKALSWITPWLKSFPEENINKIKFVMTQPDEFECKVYTNVNLFEIDKNQRLSLIDAVDSLLFNAVTPEYQKQEFGKVERLRSLNVLHNQTAIVNEAKGLKNSVVVCHFEIDPEMANEKEDWEQTANWLNSLVVRPKALEDEIGLDKTGWIKKVQFEMNDPEYSEFDCKVYTNVDINTLSEKQIKAIQRGVENFVLYTIGKEYEKKPFSKVVKNRVILAHRLKSHLENESKRFKCDSKKKVVMEKGSDPDSKEKQLLALATDDYQNRNGDYPEAGEPDVIQVYKAGGTYNVDASFKNTPESLAERWLKNYLSQKGFDIEKIDTRQDGEYQDDWVLATAVIDRSIITESSDKDPSEESPLKIDAPRGEYWVWIEGGDIYGSAIKPNPNQNIVNARAFTNFTAQGFDTLDEVIEYVKKYF